MAETGHTRSIEVIGFVGNVATRFRLTQQYDCIRDTAIALPDGVPAPKPAPVQLDKKVNGNVHQAFNSWVRNTSSEPI